MKDQFMFQLHFQKCEIKSENTQRLNKMNEQVTAQLGSFTASEKVSLNKICFKWIYDNKP